MRHRTFAALTLGALLSSGVAAAPTTAPAALPRATTLPAGPHSALPAGAHSAEFLKLVPDPTALVKVVTGLKFLEGPTWLTEKRVLVYSDVGGSRQYSFDPAAAPDEASRPVVFVAASQGSNGTTLDREGRLLVCRRDGRDVIRFERDGSVTTLASRFEGKRFNSPNDVVVAADGTIYFTDPPYGVTAKTREIAVNAVYRISTTGEVTQIITELAAPNGLALSLDGSELYVAESSPTVKPKFINRYRLNAGGPASNPVRFYTVPTGTPDGLRVDAAGNVWTSAGDGVHVVSPGGELIGIIPVPEVPANLAFGNPESPTLFITARTSLYAIRIRPPAAVLPERRGSGK